MSSSLVQSMQTVLRGLWKGSLDDHRVLLLLRSALFVIVVTMIVEVAVDPVIRGFASIADLQNAADPTLRERILTAWAKVPLIGRARLYLWIDAIAFAPACLLFLVTLALHFMLRLVEDGTAPVFLAADILAGTPAGAAAGLCRGGAPRRRQPLCDVLGGQRRHAPRRVAARHDACTLYGGARAAGIRRDRGAWVFASWFFRSREDGDGSAAQIGIAARQARLRAAIADMLWRSKYRCSSSCSSPRWSCSWTRRATRCCGRSPTRGAATPPCSRRSSASP